MGAKKIDLGVTGMTVAANVARYRADTSYVELSRRMAEAGRPIGRLGLRDIEAGRRYVTVDDLAALAEALGTSVLALLSVTEHDVRRLALPPGRRLAGIVHPKED